MSIRGASLVVDESASILFLIYAVQRVIDLKHIVLVSLDRLHHLLPRAELFLEVFFGLVFVQCFVKILNRQVGVREIWAEYADFGAST